MVYGQELIGCNIGVITGEDVMKYLGIARKEKGQLVMPDGFRDVEEGRTYEAIEIGGDILLAPALLDRERLAKVERLAKRSIDEHRKSLEGLAR